MEPKIENDETFKEKYKRYNASHDTEFGDIKYHSKNDCLEVPMYCSYGIEKCIEHAKANDWKYIFIFNEWFKQKTTQKEILKHEKNFCTYPCHNDDGNARNGGRHNYSNC